MNKIFKEIIGWSGAILILVAYILLNLNLLNPASLSYQALNIAGAIGIIYHSFSKRDYQPIVLNLIWGLVALFAVINILIK